MLSRDAATTTGQRNGSAVHKQGEQIAGLRDRETVNRVVYSSDLPKDDAIAGILPCRENVQVFVLIRPPNQPDLHEQLMRYARRGADQHYPICVPGLIGCDGRERERCRCGALFGSGDVYVERRHPVERSAVRAGFACTRMGAAQDERRREQR